MDPNADYFNIVKSNLFVLFLPLRNIDKGHTSGMHPAITTMLLITVSRTFAY